MSDSPKGCSVNGVVAKLSLSTTQSETAVEVLFEERGRERFQAPGQSHP